MRRSWSVFPAVVFLAVSGFFAIQRLDAAVPRDFAIDLKATVSDSAPHITLSWTQRVQSNITAQKIHRRLKGETTWVKLADLTTTQTSYVDATALPNVEYEYWMERNLTGLTPNVAMGYLSAGVKVAEVHSRGKLLLVIDDTMVAPLAPEIAQLKLDLAADGWTVVPITAPRSGTAISTKALIVSAYNADPANVKAVFLLGYVPVPYSGNQAPDGHGDHVGAWPADGYYGDMDGTWTDTTVNNTTASRAQNDNIPGDGKFDQTSFPSLVELQVGRVDFHNLNRSPATAVTEVARLRRYLRRAHDFRHKQGGYAAIPRRTLIRDGFGHAFTSEPFAVTAWMGAFACVGQAPDAPIDEAPGGQWFSPTYAGGKDYLWGHGCGGGSHEYASSLGVSMEFGRKTSRVVFTSVFGSYHGDWDADNNLMRSVIAGNADGDSLGLTCFWAGRPNWFPHQPGMGETMGYMTRTSMNGGITGGGSYVPGGSSYRGIHIGLMGDPALRMHAVEPPRRLTATSANTIVDLNWAASSETGLVGYHVYRADTPDGAFVRLTANPTSSTSYADNTVTAGNTYTYLVRTLKLESVPGGSYYNLSIGSPVTVTAASGGTSTPRNPSELTAATPASSTSAALAWADNSSDETGFRIERKTNAAGAWGTIATLGANAVSHTDSGPFTQGNVYYYRVIATGSGGDSIPSNESSFDAVAGFFEHTATKTKVNKNAGTIDLTVNRFGGAVGAVSVNYATANSSAIAGTHYTSKSGTLSWADGDLAPKTISISITNTGTPQLPRQFKVNLSSPTNGSAVAQWSSIAVLIEDPTATLDPAWTSAMIGTITDQSPAVSAEGFIGDATMGGSGVGSGSTSEAGRFIYQSRSGDGVMTMRVPTPVTAQNGARFAVMVRATTANNAIAAAAVAASAAANHGTKLASRSTVGGGMTVLPSADNNQDTPQWLRLTRAGTTFTAESSVDGTTWTVLGSAAIASMPSTALWGIFHYSTDWAASSTYLGDYQLATYDNISITGLPAPETPANLAFGTVTNTSVPLTWTAAPYAAGYRIERRGDDGSVDLVANPTSGSTVNHTDNTIRPDTGYEYRIQSYNDTGESAWSAPIRTMVPAADENFAITTDDAGGADAFIRFDNQATNFGAGETLPVADTAIADGAMTPVTKAYLRFNLGTLPALKSARLKLAYTGGVGIDETFAIENMFWLSIRMLADSSDTWEETGITWENAPQNNLTTPGLTGTATTLANYFHFDASTIPAIGTVATINVNPSTLHLNRGTNNLVTLAILPSATFAGSLIWASREHPTLPPPTLEVTTASTKPARPGFLTLTPGSGSSVVLSWIDFTTGETGFEIERRVANGGWTLLTTASPDTTTFTDSTALPGIYYDYRIRAITPTGVSSWLSVAAISRTGAASITGAIRSDDGLSFSTADAPPQKAYVPTGFEYYTPSSNFVTAQTLSTSPLRNNFNGWLGCKFTTGPSPVVVRELARWVLSGNTGTHTVRIVDANTNATVPGASVAVNTAGAPVGFTYAPLAVPVTLEANHAYYLVSQEVSGGDQWYEGNNTLTTYATSVATVNQSVFSSNGTSFSLSFSANNTYIPVSFRYSTPASAFVSGHTLSVLRNDASGWFGMEFTTGNTILSLSRLGRWVAPGNSGVHAVRLIDATTGNLLASTSVDTAGAPAGQMVYGSLPALVTLAANSRYYLLSQETAGGDQWYDIRLPNAGAANGYYIWLLNRGLPMDGSGDGIASGDLAGDGLSTLMKYALGLEPETLGHQGRLAFGEVTIEGSRYLTFSYTRPDPAPAGITYTVEGGNDLATWTDIGIVLHADVLNGDLRTLTYRDTTAIGAGAKRFLRLRVSQQ
ncbi:MAG: fibronectin type III domain-containing protein [Verrucomicrobiales bacterium]|nr:fibronectin type III domain-containing protein [Verrucomicrobiales bacterium]